MSSHAETPFNGKLSEASHNFSFEMPPPAYVAQGRLSTSPDENIDIEAQALPPHTAVAAFLTAQPGTDKSNSTRPRCSGFCDGLALFIFGLMTLNVLVVPAILLVLGLVDFRRYGGTMIKMGIVWFICLFIGMPMSKKMDENKKCRG